MSLHYLVNQHVTMREGQHFEHLLNYIVAFAVSC